MNFYFLLPFPETFVAALVLFQYYIFFIPRQYAGKYTKKDKMKRTRIKSSIGIHTQTNNKNSNLYQKKKQFNQ